MTFVRHRDRMVQESVFEDLVNSLIACRWLSGTTSRPVVSPYAPTAGFQTVTTAPDQTLKMVADAPVQLVDYFPDVAADGPNSIEERAEVGDSETNTPAPNTLAMDDGQAGDPTPLEMGSNAMEVPYRFTFAFWASTVGVAQALLNDLRDRYQGHIVAPDAINLYDYNVDPSTPVVRMEVDGFSYTRAADESAEAYEVTMFYAQLLLTDVVDAKDLTSL